MSILWLETVDLLTHHQLNQMIPMKEDEKRRNSHLKHLTQLILWWKLLINLEISIIQKTIR